MKLFACSECGQLPRIPATNRMVCSRLEERQGTGKSRHEGLNMAMVSQSEHQPSQFPAPQQCQSLKVYVPHGHLHCVSSRRYPGGEEIVTRTEMCQRGASITHTKHCWLPWWKGRPPALGLSPKGKDKSYPWCTGNQTVISSPALQPGHHSVLLSTLSPAFIEQRGMQSKSTQGGGSGFASDFQRCRRIEE